MQVQVVSLIPVKCFILSTFTTLKRQDASGSQKGPLKRQGGSQRAIIWDVSSPLRAQPEAPAQGHARPPWSLRSTCSPTLALHRALATRSGERAWPLQSAQAPADTAELVAAPVTQAGTVAPGPQLVTRVPLMMARASATGMHHEPCRGEAPPGSPVGRLPLADAPANARCPCQCQMPLSANASLSVCTI